MFTEDDLAHVHEAAAKSALETLEVADRATLKAIVDMLWERERRSYRGNPSLADYEASHAREEAEWRRINPNGEGMPWENRVETLRAVARAIILFLRERGWSPGRGTIIASNEAEP